MLNKRVELLAPCGDKETFMTALNSGADAIYLGAKNFNARQKANNFADKEMRECINLAHLFGVKVYLTLNVLIKNDEFEEVEKIVDNAIDANIDAFIIQDLGLAYFLKNKYRGIVLHASTQMGICNVEGAKIAKSLGFSRIVLSREVKLTDIKRIKEETDLEIEYFVQGALCVSFSGNCYLSSVTNNKSGNRGECLQLCRLPYRVENKNGYFLSTTDLCLIERLDELIQAGVDSFKIEGRLRRSGYIAQTVQSYRNVIDGLSTAKEEKEKLYKIFERGTFNTGYHLDSYNDARIINPLYQNHRGQTIGEVISVKPFKDLFEIEVYSEHKIVQGDGIKFLSSDKTMGVGNVYNLGNNKYKLFSKTRPKIKEKISLMVDSEYEKSICAKTRKLPINIAVIAKVGQKPTIHISCNEIEIVEQLDNICPKAINKTTSQQEIVDNITKLGNTVFEIDNCMVISNNVFLAKSQINELRRKGIDKLINQLLIKNCPNTVQKVAFELGKTNSKKIKLTVVDDLNNIDIHTPIIFAPKNYNNSIIEPINKLAKNQKIYLLVPVCSSEEFDIIKNIVSKLDTSVGIFACNISGLSFKRDIIVNYTLNIVNDYSLAFLNSMNIDKFVNSIEPIFSDYNKGMSYCGQAALMLLTHCPYKTVLYGNCKSCMSEKKLIYNDKYSIRKYSIIGCYFELCAMLNCGNDIIDTRS